MKEEKVTEKKSGGMSEFWRKASDAGKKVADGVSKGTKSLAEKAKEYNHEQKLKKYNPLTMEEYKSESFHIPNVICIIDDLERRTVDVCEGAIGKRKVIDKVEVLYLYDEEVNNIGIEFVPVAKCDCVYCMDPFDRKKFVRVDYIFGKATEEKLAELAHIAHKLGAKCCSVEIVETNNDISISEKKANVKRDNEITIIRKKKNKEEADKYINDIDVDVQYSKTIKNLNSRSGKTVTHFEGSREPEQPTLKWFAHDDNIRGLVDMCCENKNSVKSKTLELCGSISTTMSIKTACVIDKIISNPNAKIQSKYSTSMESQAIKEQSSKLIFEIEF